MIESEKNLSSNLATYKKAKKVCLTILDAFGEGMELSRKELFVINYIFNKQFHQDQIGLEDEADIFKNLK